MRRGGGRCRRDQTGLARLCHQLADEEEGGVHDPHRELFQTVRVDGSTIHPDGCTFEKMPDGRISFSRSRAVASCGPTSMIWIFTGIFARWMRPVYCRQALPMSVTASGVRSKVLPGLVSRSIRQTSVRL